MGKNVKVKFTVEGDKDVVVISYDGTSGSYGIYFPFDRETVYMEPSEADLRFIN